ncbi:MAG TPA: periplasmic heavy metal sensor [Alphaproteobacteria bacterium]|nr:periplasmic heavy metal sensor [Alphaproteobacteria bacterium]
MILSRGTGLLAVLLVVSVAINLFLGGNELGLRFHHPPPPMNMEQRFEMLFQTLPDADRAIAREAIDRHREQLLDKLHEYRAAAGAAAAIVRADPFNEEAARAAFAKADDASVAFRHEVQDTVIDIAGKVSTAGRSHLRAGLGGP